MADRTRQIAWAAAFLRVGVGLVFLYHGAQMMFGAFGGRGLDGTASRISGHLGFEPGTFWAILIGGGVFLSGLFLLIGLFTRPASIPAALASFLGIFWREWNTVIFNNEQVPIPYSWMLLSAAMAIYFLGPGNLSIDKKIAQERADARGS